MKPALTTFANWRTYDVNMKRTCGYTKYMMPELCTSDNMPDCIG